MNRLGVLLVNWSLIVTLPAWIPFLILGTLISDAWKGHNQAKNILSGKELIWIPNKKRKK